MNFAPFSALLSLRTLFSALGGAVSGWGDVLLAQLGISRSKPGEALSPEERLITAAENLSPFVIYGDFDDETAEAMGLIKIPAFASIEEEHEWWAELDEKRLDAKEAAEEAAEAARWAAGDAAYFRFMDSSRQYIRLNWPRFGFGMRPLWASAAGCIFSKFQNRVLGSSPDCALFVPVS
jgi:hypothetical protein